MVFAFLRNGVQHDCGQNIFDSSLPKDLLDAAQIDGCGNLVILFLHRSSLQKAVIAVIASHCRAVELFTLMLGLHTQRELLKPLQLVVRKYPDHEPVFGGAGDGMAAQEAMRVWQI